MATKLYPLKFRPIYKYRIWGGNKLKTMLHKHDAPLKCGESWEISAVAKNVSVVANGFLADNDIEEIIEVYMGDIVGDAVFEQFGIQFPLLVKFIDATDNLSIQVHPNDKIAAEKYGQNGKTEMWYIIDADINSENVTGIKETVSLDKFDELLCKNRIEESLQRESSSANDVFYIPAGRLHAAGKGNLFVEIQQTSDITYRLHDYDREDSNGMTRDLDITDGFSAIDDSQRGSAKVPYNLQKNTVVNIIDCPYFVTNCIEFDRKIIRNYVRLDSFVIYVCTEGKFTIHCEENLHVETLQRGETCLVPAAINELELVPATDNVKILEVYIKSN